jgi:hypothetical protein
VVTEGTGRPVGRPQKRIANPAILEAVQQGRLATFYALRDGAAAAIEQGCEARDLSSLTILIMHLLRDIEKMEQDALTGPRPWDSR